MKISYEQLDLEVTKLYLQPFDGNDIESVILHCDRIGNFIEACGWRIDQYLEEGWDRMIRDRKKN